MINGWKSIMAGPGWISMEKFIAEFLWYPLGSDMVNPVGL